MLEPVAGVEAVEEIYRGRVVHLRLERARLPDGRSTSLELIVHPGASAIVPLAGDGRVWLVRQWRHATGSWLLEVPAGKLEPGEEPRACAMRECEEETGWRPQRLIELGVLWTTPGFTDEQIHLFLGLDLIEGTPGLQADEALTAVAVPLEAAVRMALEGEIADGKSIVALLRAHHHCRECSSGPDSLGAESDSAVAGA